MFSPIHTARLELRPFRAGDAIGLFERRNTPEVAHHQNWLLPYSLEQANELVDELVAMEGPVDDEWWMLLVTEFGTGLPVGDLALHLSSEGRTAEIGYTLDPAHWGRGYAVEAVDALVAYLFEERHVTRVFGTLHPDNRPSAMVLERTGFIFEGHTRLSFWLGDHNSDDHIYGLTRRDWELWRDRIRTPPGQVQLVPVTNKNESVVRKLRTHKTQETLVAPTIKSFADALFPETVDRHPVLPWMRAIAADDEIVGFVMLALSTEYHPEPYLWRLLIDRMHQRRGIASKALALVEAECRAMGDRTILTSWSEDKGTPKPFYLARGFELTGRIIDDETEARKRLA